MRDNKIIKDRIINFNKSIENLNSKEAVKMAKKEVDYLLREYTVKTTRTYLTFYRKSLQTDSYGVFKALSIPDKLQKIEQKKYKRSVAKSNKKGIEVRNVNDMISRAISLLDSDNIGELTASLCLMTGRRMTEILKTAKFTNSRNSQKVMYFKGQLKTKDENMKYEIYVLNNMRDKCKSALKKLRSMVDTKKMSNYEVSRRYENTVNSTCRRLFSSYIGKRDIDYCTAHTLRNIYAIYCLENYKKDPAQSTNSFLSEILGHGVEDNETANAYQKYFLKKKVY